MNIKNATFVILCLILLMQFALRLPFLNEPLEIDEGCYAYMGQQIQHGIIPYRDHFDHKPPMIFYIYSIIEKVFGETIFSIRFATALVGLIATIFIFLTGRQLFSDEFGLIASFLYAIFSGGPLIEGSGSNTEAFMIFFLLIALFVFTLRERSLFWLFLCGLFSGLAFMTKQVAFFNILVFIAILIMERKETAKKITSLLTGCLIFPALFAFYFLINNGFKEFINYGFLFNFGYIKPSFDLYFILRTSYIALFENSILWVLGLIGLILMVSREKIAISTILILWFLASFAGVYLGGYAFGHYYIQVIPALCFLSSYAIIKLIKGQIPVALKNASLCVCFLLALVIGWYQYPYYLFFSPAEISINKYGHSNHVVAKIVADRIMKTDNITGSNVAIGFYPQVYFYTKSKYPGKYYFNMFDELSVGIKILDWHVLSKTFVVNANKMTIIRDQKEEFVKALINKSTKYAILNRSIVESKIISDVLRNNNYSLQSKPPERDCLVYKRIMHVFNGG